MKSLQFLWMEALTDVGAWCDICTIRDGKTAAARFEDEGLSFLTITLPGFGKDFERSLELGLVTHDQFKGFAFSGGLPRFLGGFLELVFDRRSGSLLECPSVDAIFAIRQLTLMMAKIGLDCAPHRKAKAIEGYIQCETEVKESSVERTEADYLQFSRLSLLLFAPCFDIVERRIKAGELRGRHGPGNTADGLRGNSKFSGMHWNQRLEDAGLYALDHLVNGYHDFERLQDVDFREPGSEQPAKIALVPKTQKGPRIIAQEPTHMMFMQQAILEVILEAFYRDNLLCSFVGFNNQVPNQDLARIGSLNGSLATLDLSEASDRLSCQHVEFLLAQHPHFREAVFATRSLKADVPGKGVYTLAKFASMGSALTFPMEAFTFLVLVFVGIEKGLRRPLTMRDIKSFVGKVRVFGDDIICPVEFVTEVISTLEDFGLRVNAGKSFWTGKFRESCGREYYNGTDVSIVRVRAVLPTSLAHASEIESTVSTRNLFYKRGMWTVSQWLDQWMWKVLKHYPHVHDTSPMIGRFTFLDVLSVRNAWAWSNDVRKDDCTWIPMVKGYKVRPQIPVSELDGEAALLKFLLKRGMDPYELGHLERAGRSQALYLKLGWGPLGVNQEGVDA